MAEGQPEAHEEEQPNAQEAQKEEPQKVFLGGRRGAGAGGVAAGGPPISGAFGGGAAEGPGVPGEFSLVSSQVPSELSPVEVDRSIHKLNRIFQQHAQQSDGSVPSRRIDLPGQGGNQIRFVPLQEGLQWPSREQLVCYPRIRDSGLTIHFRSDEFRSWGIFVLGCGDVLAWCPQGYVCIFCFFCNKFQFPPHGQNSHRQSKKHLSNIEWAMRVGPDEALTHYRQQAAKRATEGPLFTCAA